MSSIDQSVCGKVAMVRLGKGDQISVVVKSRVLSSWFNDQDFILFYFILWLLEPSHVLCFQFYCSPMVLEIGLTGWSIVIKNSVAIHPFLSVVFLGAWSQALCFSLAISMSFLCGNSFRLLHSWNLFFCRTPLSPPPAGYISFRSSKTQRDACIPHVQQLNETTSLSSPFLAYLLAKEWWLA